MDKSRIDEQLARVRLICLAYPGTSELQSWGHPNFHVGKKAFVTIETSAGRPVIALRLVADQVRELCEGSGFFPTPYGKGLWASHYADVRLNWKLMTRLMDESFRLVAPAALLA